MQKAIHDLLPEVRRPSRYLGNEINSVKKDLSRVDLKFALCFPDTYEIGMSNIGLSILYHLLNDRPDIACERVYSPWIDMEQKLRETGIPLSSLESGIPLRGFDILGISIPYELTYTNILTILDLAGIPLLSKDRNESHPLILGGGTGAFNPEPIADFFDAILLGDGEEAVLEICDVVKEWKDNAPSRPPPLNLRGGRGELLQKLTQVRGVYVPSLFDVSYKEDGTVAKIKPLLDGYTGVHKRTVSDLDRSYFPDRPIVPHTRVVHDRIGVEVQRGCTRGCRFCQAGYVYRPERQRSPETVKEIVRNQLSATGLEAVSLVSLSIGDYDCLTPLLKDLMDEHGAKNVGISLPATRVEHLTGAMMTEIKRVRKTGFTVAPEAATERMRNVINKGNSEENLLQTVRTVFSDGWSLMKFYFMIGLPTETDEDVAAIAELGKKTLQIGLDCTRRAEINLAVSPFVPKPFTPYQWAPQISLEECRRKLNLLRFRLKSRRINLKSHRPDMSYLEGIFSRGDRRLSELIVQAWKKGCHFDGWEEGIRFDKWREAWTELGIDPSFYVERERKQDEVLPWDHLFVEMKKEWLWDEWRASYDATFIEDCSTGKCTVCGVCDFKEIRNRAYEPVKGVPASSVDLSPKGMSLTGVAYLCLFSKTGPAAFLSHLEFVDALRRAVARANLPVRFSQGFHPLQRITFGPGMPVGKEMAGQEFTIELEEAVDSVSIQERLNRQLPEGIVIEAVTAKASGGSLAPREPIPAPSPSL